MNKIELKRMIWDWNDKTREAYLHETKHTAPDYREITTGSNIVERPLSNALYINEYLPCGGSRRASIFFLDCGAMVFTEPSFNMDYAKQWGFEGVIPYEKLLGYITCIDHINVDEFHLN